MTLGQRLKKLMEAKDMSVQSFSYALKQSDKSMYNYLADRTTPKMDLAEQITEAFPEVNCRWLLSGVGEMFLADEQKAEDALAKDQASVENRIQQLEEKINDLHQIIDSNKRLIANQEEMIEMLKKG